MFRCVWVTVIALLALSPGWLVGDSPSTIPTPDFSDAPGYPVIRVIDGDTVILDINGRETRVRLIGVDTPETVHPSKQVDSKEARLFLTNLLKGERVYLDYEPDNRTDIYGRTLAYVYRVPDDLFVNLEIIRQGYGQSYTQYPFRYLDY